MSITEQTLLETCGLSVSPHCGSSLEPARYNRKVTYWTTVNTLVVVDYVEFYMNDVLLFRHVYTYDIDGNEIELLIE